MLFGRGSRSPHRLWLSKIRFHCLSLLQREEPSSSSAAMEPGDIRSLTHFAQCAKSLTPMRPTQPIKHASTSSITYLHRNPLAWARTSSHRAGADHYARCGLADAVSIVPIHVENVYVGVDSGGEMLVFKAGEQNKWAIWNEGARIQCLIYASSHSMACPYCCTRSNRYQFEMPPQQRERWALERPIHGPVK